MDLKELESKHLKVWIDHSDIPSESSKQNTIVSIEYTISVLESLKPIERIESGDVLITIMLEGQIMKLKEQLQIVKQ